jgi:hypothetical protein
MRVLINAFFANQIFAPRLLFSSNLVALAKKPLQLHLIIIPHSTLNFKLKNVFLPS